MTNQSQTFNSGKPMDDTKQSTQVKDTDAALTDKNPAATTLNPNSNFAKPDPTMGADEGWNSDAKGKTLGTQNVAATETSRREWQNTDRQNQPTTPTDVKNQVKQAADEVRQGASSITEQAKQAASETVDQAKQAVNDTLGQAKRQVSVRFDEQKSQAAGRLSSVANALRQTGESLQSQNEDTFGRYAHAAADQIEQFSDTLQNKNMTEMLNEIQSFARRQPELFVAGSLAAGFLLGEYQQGSPSSPHPAPCIWHAQAFAEHSHCGVSEHRRPERYEFSQQ